MRRARTILAAALLLGLAPAAAHAKRSDFIGTWHNGDTSSEIASIRVTTSYQVYVNNVTYAGILVTYGTSGAPDGHTTALIVLKAGSKTTTLVLGLGNLLASSVDTNKLWSMKLIDLANYNSDGNTHKYMAFHRHVLPLPKPPALEQQPVAP